MIRQEIDVNVNDVTMTGEITVPSPVIAITSQEETYDLTERKNFSIKLKDTDGVIVLDDGSSYINVDFEFGGKIYNADMSIYKRSINGDVTLQYASGLTAEDVSDDSSDDSSDEPETHTLAFDSDNYATSYDTYTGEKTQARFNVLYDGTSIHLASSMFSGLVYNKIEPIETAGAIFKAKDSLPEVSLGQYVDNVTVTYEGISASCTVTLTVTNSDPEHVPTQRITCTTSRGEFVIYDSDPDSSTDTIQYTDTFDKTGLDVTPGVPYPWIKTQLKYYVDGIEQNVLLQSDAQYPWDDDGDLRLDEEPSEMYTDYTVTGGLGYWDDDNFVEIAPSNTMYTYMKVNPDYTWYVDGDATITTLSTSNTSDFSGDGITLTDKISIWSDPDIMLTNRNYDIHIESVGITYDNQTNLIECDPNSDVAFVLKDFADHSQESNYEPVHFTQISLGGINTTAANEIVNQITTDEFGNTINWNNEEIPDVGRSILSCDLSDLDTFKMNLTPIIQQVGSIIIENIQIFGLAGGADDASDDSSDDSSDEPSLDKYLDVECSLSSNSKTMALPQGNNNLQTDIYAAVYLVDPNTVVGEGTENEHYYTKVVISQNTLDNMHGMEETLEQLGWWGTKPYDDYLIVPSVNEDVILIDSNGNNFIVGTDAWGDNYKGIWRFDQLESMQATIFDVHGMRLYLTGEGPYTKTFDLATPYLRVMRNGSPDTSGTFYGTVDQNTNETVWSDYLIYPVYDDMYGGTYNASNGSDFLGQYNNGGTFVGQYVSGEPHGYPFIINLGAFALDPWMFEEQDPQEVLIEWRRSNPEAIPEYNEDTVNQYPYKVLYSQTYNFSLQVPE